MFHLVLLKELKIDNVVWPIGSVVETDQTTGIMLCRFMFARHATQDEVEKQTSDKPTKKGKKSEKDQ